MMTEPYQHDERAEDHLGLVSWCADKFHHGNEPLEDSEEYGCALVGLAKALNNFDPLVGTFATFARKCIMSELMNNYRLSRQGMKGKEVSFSFQTTDGEGHNLLGVEDDEVELEPAIPHEREAYRMRVWLEENAARVCLSEDDETILAAYLGGKNITQIAREMECSRQNINRKMKRIQAAIKEIKPEGF